MLEAAAFEPLHHVGACLDAIEGARRGPLDRSSWAGLLCSSSSLLERGCLGNVVTAEPPLRPDPALAWEEGQDQVWDERGRGYV